jgi:protocatechuate 3,4-dioxygenase beta subunit
MRPGAVVVLLLFLPVQASLQQPATGRTAGQAVDAAEAGTVAGRVVDVAGRPIAGIAVALWFTQYDENGRRSLGDVEGLEFRLMPWVTLHGRLRVDGQPLSSLSGAETIRVRLLPSRGGIPMASFSQLTLQSQFMPARDDGTFDIVSIAPGEFRLHVAGLPSDAYAKEARLGSADVLNGPLQFNGSAADVLEVVIGPNGGRIDGTAIEGGGAPAPNAFVVLMPTRRDRIDLFRSMSADSGGRFTFRGIAPGEYAVVAGPEFQGYAYFDPDVLKRFERGSVRVTVRDGSRANVEVSVPPRTAVTSR